MKSFFEKVYRFQKQRQAAAKIPRGHGVEQLLHLHSASDIVRKTGLGLKTGLWTIYFEVLV